MELKVIMTTAEKLNNIDIIPGQLIFVQDQNPAIYLDNSVNNRILMSNVGEEVDIPKYLPGDGILFEYDELNNTITINNLGVTVEIKDNTWWINGEDTGVVAVGQDGQDGLTPIISIDSTTSEWVINGVILEGIYALADSITLSEYESLINLLDLINLGITTALKGVGI